MQRVYRVLVLFSLIVVMFSCSLTESKRVDLESTITFQNSTNFGWVDIELYCSGFDKPSTDKLTVSLNSGESKSVVFKTSMSEEYSDEGQDVEILEDFRENYSLPYRNKLNFKNGKYLYDIKPEPAAGSNVAIVEYKKI